MIEWLILTYMMIGIIIVIAESRGDIKIVKGSLLEILLLRWLELIMMPINKIIRLLFKN